MSLQGLQRMSSCWVVMFALVLVVFVYSAMRLQADQIPPPLPPSYSGASHGGLVEGAKGWLDVAERFERLGPVAILGIMCIVLLWAGVKLFRLKELASQKHHEERESYMKTLAELIRLSSETNVKVASGIAGLEAATRENTEATRSMTGSMAICHEVWSKMGPTVRPR